jgi:hypothetical protein
MNTKTLNQLGLTEVRTHAAEAEQLTQIRAAIRYNPIDHLQPGSALSAAQQTHPDFVLLEESGRWKGKVRDSERLWIYGASPEEVLWKIVLWG